MAKKQVFDHIPIAEKRPRQYAQQICRIQGKAGRAEALQAVPGHLREWAKLLVMMRWERGKFNQSQN